MISFKQFLTEKKVKSWDVNIVDLKKTIDILNKHCPQGLKAISSNGLLYRGFKHKHAVMTIDPSVGERTSRDTNNLYQLMMETSTALADYPRRSQSLICSSDRSEAASYGSVMVIIPYDGTEIVVTDRDDFIYNKILTPQIDIEELSDNFAAVLKETGVRLPNQFMPADIPRINKRIDVDPDAFIKSWVKWFSGTNEKSFRRFVEQNKGKVFEALSSSLMTPKNLKLKKQIFGQKIKFNVECWFSGKCVAIDIRLFAAIIHALKQNKFKVHPDVFDEVSYLFDHDMEISDFVLDYVRKNLK